MEISEALIRRVDTYKAPSKALASIKDIPLLFMVGITGAGKDTLLNQLASTYPDKYAFTVSYTTRPPRTNDGVVERDGVEYHFIDVATAERMINEGEYLETNHYAGNIYGTSIEDIARLDVPAKLSSKMWM